MKAKISIQNCLYRYKNLKLPLISGEFSYWAVMKENWPAVMRSVRAMGVNIVSSCVPWSFHELEPGKYDFEGKTHPQRDLKGFVKMLREEGLYFMIRPGPYIYAGWPFGGPPEYATKVDRFSPEFMKMAEPYIRSICEEVIAPFQVTRGGSIIMVQADNEPYPAVESFGNELGCYSGGGLFKTWLRKKYRGSIAALNKRWRTKYRSFNEACFYFHEVCVNTDLPMAARLLPDESCHVRYADSFEFVGWYAAEIVAAVGKLFRKAGVEVPIYANSWSPLYADFNKFCEVADIAGTDIYPFPFMEGAKLSRDNWLYNLDIVKMSEANVTNGNVWSAEFQCGIYPLKDTGYIPPSHYKFIPMTLMARGLKGWNWYLLVHQYAWPHSPITEWGRTNEYYPVHKEVVELTNKIEPWNLEPLYDVDLVVHKPHRVIDPGNFEEVFQAIEAADISYRYADPQMPKPYRSKSVVYSGSEWLDAESAGKLAAHVKSGGILIAFSRCPVRDEFGKPFKDLPFAEPDGARPVNLPVTAGYGKGAALIANAGHLGRKVNFGYFHRAPGEPIWLTLSAHAREALVDMGVAKVSGFIMGYVRKVGKGKIIHIGSNPSPDILKMILEQEGSAPYASVPEKMVTSSVHRHEDGSLLCFIVNRNPHPVKTVLKLNLKRLGIRPGKSCTVENITGGDTRRVNGSALAGLPVEAASHDVAVYRIGK